MSKLSSVWSTALWHISVFPGVGGVPPVPRKLHHHDPLSLHLAHPLPSHLEVSCVTRQDNRYLSYLALIMLKHAVLDLVHALFQSRISDGFHVRFLMIKFPTTSVRVCTLDRCKKVLLAGFGESESE